MSLRRRPGVCARRGAGGGGGETKRCEQRVAAARGCAGRFLPRRAPSPARSLGQATQTPPPSANPHADRSRRHRLLRLRWRRADCGARLRIRGPIAVLGDIAYDNGSAADFANCFMPSWGPLVPRIRAALGNHEYNSGGARPRSSCFRLPERGWYSYSLGAWHVVVLNSNCDKIGGCDRVSPQWRWLKADLAAHRNRCTLAYWHHPRYSSGTNGSDVALAPFWALLSRAKADVVLQGHDHDYERFAPLQGIRSFVVGTGGKSHYPTRRASPGQRRAQQRHLWCPQAHAPSLGLRLEVPGARQGSFSDAGSRPAADPRLRRRDGGALGTNASCTTRSTFARGPPRPVRARTARAGTARPAPASAA